MIAESQRPPAEEASEPASVAVCSICGAEDLEANMVRFQVQGYEPCDHYIEMACIACQDHEEVARS